MQVPPAEPALHTPGAPQAAWGSLVREAGGLNPRQALTTRHGWGRELRKCIKRPSAAPQTERNIDAVIFSIIKISLFCSFSVLLSPAQSWLPDCTRACVSRPRRPGSHCCNQNVNETLIVSLDAQGPPPAPHVAGLRGALGSGTCTLSRRGCSSRCTETSRGACRTWDAGGGAGLAVTLVPVLPGGILQAWPQAGADPPRPLSKVLAPPHPGHSPPDTPWSQLMWDGQSHVSQMDGLGHSRGPAWLGGRRSCPQKDAGPHRLCHLELCRLGLVAQPCSVT